MRFIEGLKALILNTLFPPVCVSCKREGDFLCAECLENLDKKKISPVYCKTDKDPDFHYMDGVIYALDYAKNPDSHLSGPAIECLGKLKSKEAVGVLASILERSKETECLLACCRALGQIADPASIEPLAHLLMFKGFRLWRRRKNPEVRAAATYALGQIAHPRAAEILAPYADDLDPRVRDVVRVRLAGAPRPNRGILK